MKTIRISAGATENYDLMLNSGIAGIEKCVGCDLPGGEVVTGHVCINGDNRNKCKEDD